MYSVHININFYRNMNKNDDIEQVPVQQSTTYVRTAPVKAMFKSPSKKLSREERKQQEQSAEIAREILEEDNMRKRKQAGIIEDLPLQTEYPELFLLPVGQEIKMFGLGKGLLRTIGGLTGSRVGANLGYWGGQKGDKMFRTNIFAPIGRFIGSLFGYGFGSGVTGNMLSRIPRKYTVGPVNERTFLAEDQTPRYNPNQIEQYPRVSTMRTTKPWRSDPTKVNNTQRFYLQGQEGKGYFELVEDLEPGNYSVHFKPTDASNPNAFTEVEKRALFQAIANAVPNGGNLSTWGSISRGGLAGINRFGSLGFNQTGTRSLVMKGTGEPVDVPIFTKSDDVRYDLPIFNGKPTIITSPKVRKEILDKYKEKYLLFEERPEYEFKTNSGSYYRVGHFPMTDELRLHKKLIEQRLDNFASDWKSNWGYYRDPITHSANMYPAQKMLDKVGENGVTVVFPKDRDSQYAGWFSRSGPLMGESFVTANPWRIKPPRYTQLHESISHATDDLVHNITNKSRLSVIDAYKQVSEPQDLFPEYYKYFVNSGESHMPEEARAMNQEMIKRINEILSKKTGKSLEEVYNDSDLLNNFVDTNLSDNDNLLKFLDSFNSSYLSDYANLLRNNMNTDSAKQYADRIRNMIKTLPAITGLGVIGLNNVPQKQE